MHPPRPPLPVLKKRPLHFSGSQTSIRRLDRADVVTSRPTRQRFAETICDGRTQLGSVFGNFSVVFAVIYSVKETVPLGTTRMSMKEVQLAEKVAATAEPVRLNAAAHFFISTMAIDKCRVDGKIDCSVELSV